VAAVLPHHDLYVRKKKVKNKQEKDGRRRSRTDKKTEGKTSGSRV